MTCPVDSAAWAKANRVRLYRGKRNVWTFARTLSDRADLGLVEQTAKALLVKLFAGWPLDTQFADAGYAVDGIEVVHAGKLRPRAVPDEQRREQLPGPIALLKAGPSVFVTLAFNYRGFEEDMPWPVWGHVHSLLKSEKLCPVQADWVLSSALPVDKLRPAPAELSPLDKIALHGGATGLSGVAHLATVIKWGLYAYLGVTAARVLAPAVADTARKLGRAA